MTKYYPTNGEVKMNDDNNLVTDAKGVNCTIINKATAVSIGEGVANDTKLVGIIITKALTGTLVITGFADSDETAVNLTFPASTAAGVINFNHALNSTGALKVICSNDADRGNVVVTWVAA